MAKAEKECKFETKADQVEFTTKTNGDFIMIRNLHLTQEQSSSLAWLINSGESAILEVQIKIKE